MNLILITDSSWRHDEQQDCDASICTTPTDWKVKHIHSNLRDHIKQ